MYAPLQMSSTVYPADVDTTVAATCSGMDLPPMFLSFISSTNMDTIATGAVMFSAMTTHSSTGGASVAPTLSADSPLFPICKRI